MAGLVPAIGVFGSPLGGGGRAATPNVIGNVAIANPIIFFQDARQRTYAVPEGDRPKACSVIRCWPEGFAQAQVRDETQVTVGDANVQPPANIFTCGLGLWHFAIVGIGVSWRAAKFRLPNGSRTHKQLTTEKARFDAEKAAFKAQKKQDEKFVELARESGADESEGSFVAKVRAVYFD